MWQVIGQDRAVDFLRRSLEGERLAHAYLFSGPEHVGKMTLALSLAQALNCSEAERPCGACHSCRRIASSNHPDVQVVRRGGEESGNGVRKGIGIGQMRELQHVASLKPYEGSYHVFIIESAEHLTDEAANSLLKTLEEPAADVVFLLLTAKENLLPPTVASRCQRIELPPIPAPTVEQALVERGAEPERARLLARICRGGIGWALSALGDETLLQERTQRLEQLAGLSAVGITERFAYAAELATRFSKNRDTVYRELELWRGWWRDLLLIEAGCPHLVVNIDHEATLHHQAGRYPLAQSKGFIEAIAAASQQLEQNANPRLVLETLMLDIPAEKGMPWK